MIQGTLKTKIINKLYHSNYSELRLPANMISGNPPLTPLGNTWQTWLAWHSEQVAFGLGTQTGAGGTATLA